MPRKTLEKPGYHLEKMYKGILGESSKLLEEVYELIDAEKQQCRVMAIIELSDLIGAMRAYIARQGLGVTMTDLEKMSQITERAFKNGHRK